MRAMDHVLLETFVWSRSHANFIKFSNVVHSRRSLRERNGPRANTRVSFAERTTTLPKSALRKDIGQNPAFIGRADESIVETLEEVAETERVQSHRV